MEAAGMGRGWSGPLIDASELAARLDDPDVRVADVRWYLADPRRGQAEYGEGHIPGAIFVDLDRDLASAGGPGRHPLPDPTAFADRLGELGFGDQHDIAVYDTVSGSVAGRLWWMLDRLGHPAVALLDGGLAAWQEAGGGVTGVVPTHLRASLTLASSWPGTLDREAVAEGTMSGSIDLIDLRAAERFRGEVEPVDRVPGHIPGARNRPADSLVDDRGRLLPADRLGALLGTPIDRPDVPMVMSCGSGVTACLGVLAARLAGLPEPLLYPGSYSDWAASGMPVSRRETR
jgi:thiosulfate/3-mercaptopyruvate sulfurtransferase